MSRREAKASEVDSYTTGMALYRAGRYDRALECLAQLGGRGDLLGNLATFYTGMSHRAMGIEALRRREFDPAEKHLRAAAASLGREADLTSYLAGIYANTARYRACATEMEKACDDGQAGADARRKLAQAQWRAGQRAEAYMTLTAADRRFGRHAGLNLQLGLFYAAEERFAEAYRCFRVAVDADCTDPEAHYYLALSAAAQGAVQTAAGSLQRALDLRPGDVLVALQLCLAAKAASESGRPVVLRLPEPVAAPTHSQLRQLANYVTAESDFVEAFLALPASPSDGELFEMLSGVLRVALAEHNGYADLHYCCGRVFGRLGEADKALEHARRAVEINPRYVQALLALARVHAEQGRLDRAVEYIRRAIRCGADWPDTHCQAGEWMIRIRRPREARTHLHRALQLKARYPRATEALASLAA